MFAAFSNQETKRRWFAEGEGWQVDEFTMDFRVGGLETSRFRFQGGAPMRNDTIYLGIIPERRIVLAYTMTRVETRISSSLATVELAPVDCGTHLIYTGADATVRRERGSRALLDRLGAELQDTSEANRNNGGTA